MTGRERELLNFLGSFLSDPRKSLIEQVLQNRTRHLTVVLENIYQPQNASAVIRTCDCFGIQDLHVIENSHEFKVNPKVVHGSSKWVSLHRYDQHTDNTECCLSHLRDQGYCIVGTSPSSESKSILDLDIQQKTALVFGTEATGLTDLAKEECDMLVTYPMFGFTESLNISVSVSLCLGALVPDLHRSDIPWQLTGTEMDELRLSWYRQSVSRSDILEREFLKKLQ